MAQQSKRCFWKPSGCSFTPNSVVIKHSLGTLNKQIVHRDWCEKIQAAYENEDTDDGETKEDIEIGK